MDSFSSYFLAKNPDRQDFFAPAFSTVLVLTASVSTFLVDFSAVLDLVDSVFLDLVDDFDFLVAIFPPLMIFILLYHTFRVIMEKVINLFRNNMGVIVNKQNTNKDELSKRIDANLRERQLATADIEGNPDPDFEEDSEYIKNMKQTGRFGWVWIVLIVLAVISIISIIFI